MDINGTTGSGSNREASQQNGGWHGENLEGDGAGISMIGGESEVRKLE